MLPQNLLLHGTALVMPAPVVNLDDLHEQDSEGHQDD